MKAKVSVRVGVGIDFGCRDSEDEGRASNLNGIVVSEVPASEALLLAHRDDHRLTYWGSSDTCSSQEGGRGGERERERDRERET